jgi:hypothetical protein
MGITRDQSSRWQRMARLINDETFAAAMGLAKATGELTTSALLRLLKASVKPKGEAEVNINVLASDVLRSLEAELGRQRLDEVVRLKHRLNPTLRQKIIVALTYSAHHAIDATASLKEDMPVFTEGLAHQRQVRNLMASQSDDEPDLDVKLRLAVDFSQASVKLISYEQARAVILQNEYLATTGTADFCWGLYFGEYLGGVVCFGRTGGNSANLVCGEEHSDKVTFLTRGACCFWAHKHSGSYLVGAACRLMVEKGFPVVVAYSDPDGGERGVIYRACNFEYAGMTASSKRFKTIDGKVHDSRQVSGLARDRTGGVRRMKRTRAEQKQLLLEQGAEFFDGTPKARFILISGDRRTKRTLRAALRWKVEPFICDPA